MHDEVRLHPSGLLVGVGHHAADEVGLGGHQSLHQILQLGFVEGGHSLASSLLLGASLILRSLHRLARMISIDHLDQSIGSIFHHLNNGVIKGILILLQPSCQIVRHLGSIVHNGKVSIGVWFRVRLVEVGALSQQIGMQFGSK